MSLARTFVTLAALLALTACSASSGGSAPRRSSSVITTDEIRASHATTVYDLVQGTRPHWLRARGVTSLRDPATIIVYVNRVRSGGVDVLRQLRLEAVESLRFLDEVAATAQHGPGHSYGVIEVTLIAGH
jgi:hypothetical protein